MAPSRCEEGEFGDCGRVSLAVDRDLANNSQPTMASLHYDITIASRPQGRELILARWNKLRHITRRSW